MIGLLSKLDMKVQNEIHSQKKVLDIDRYNQRRTKFHRGRHKHDMMQKSFSHILK